MENRGLAPVWPRRDPLLASGLPAVALVHLLSGSSVPWRNPRRPGFSLFHPSPQPAAHGSLSSHSTQSPLARHPQGRQTQRHPAYCPLTLGAEHGPSLLGLKRPSELRA